VHAPALFSSAGVYVRAPALFMVRGSLILSVWPDKKTTNNI
jgi:hypothetical protein